METVLSRVQEPVVYAVIAGGMVFALTAAWSGWRRGESLLGLVGATGLVCGLCAWIGEGRLAVVMAGFVLVCVYALFRRPGGVGPLVIGAASAYLAGNIVLLLVPSPDAGRLPETAFRTYEGAPLVLSEREERPLVVNLWATWCPPCRREMPMMMEVARDRSEDVDILFVNQGEDATRIGRFLDLADLEGTNVVLDPEERLMSRLGAFGLPTTLFFDANGDLVEIHTGEIPRHALVEGIDDLTASRSALSGVLPDPSVASGGQ